MQRLERAERPGHQHHRLGADAGQQLADILPAPPMLVARRRDRALPLAARIERHHPEIARQIVDPAKDKPAAA